MPNLFRLLILSSCTLAATAPVMAVQAQQRQTIIMSEAWARASASAAKNGAGYVTIKNTGSAPDRLIAVDAGRVASRAELHTMSVQNGIMRMRPLTNGIVIAANSTTRLAPGGHHIMFLGLKQPLKTGQSIPIILHFEKAGKISTKLAVQPIGASSYHETGHPNGHEHH